MEIFKLFGSILVNSDEADKSLAKTDKHAEGVGNTFVKGVGTAVKWGAAIGAAAGAGALALFGIATKASAAAAEIDDMAQRTNLSAETLQEYKYAAEQSGFSLSTIEASAKKLTVTMGNYASGNKTTVAAFKELGLSAVGANGKLKSTDEMFPQIISKLAGMKDITERNALMIKIFGKSAMDMAPMLNGGSAGIKELTDKAHELGLVMSNESIQAGAKFDDTLATIKSSLSALVTKVGLEVLPIFQKVLDFILQGIPKVREIIQPVFDFLKETFNNLSLDSLPKLGEGFNNISKTIMPVFQEVFKVFKNEILPDFTEGLKSLAEGVFPVIQDAFKYITEKIVPPFMEVFKFIYTEIIPKFAAAFKEWMPVIGEIVQKLWTEFIKPALDAILLAFKTVFPQIKDAVSTAMDIITAVIKGVLKFLSGFIDFISGVLTGDWEKAWKGIEKIFSAIWEAMKSVVETVIGFIVRTIDNMIGGIKKALEWLGILKKEENTQQTSSSDYSKNKSGGIDGSHASGLPYVPYDGYIAELHKGEGILKADQNPNNPETNNSNVNNPANSGITVNIENFNNDRSQTVEAFAEELEFYRRRASFSVGMGGAY